MVRPGLASAFTVFRGRWRQRHRLRTAAAGRGAGWAESTVPAPLAEHLAFIGQWASHPRAIGALLPSGAALADAITAGIGPDSGPVMELGSGTGVFTRRLLARGVPMPALWLVEANLLFARRLRIEFAEAQVLDTDAAQIGRHPAAPLPGSVCEVVCGLPLRNFAPAQQAAILASVLEVLHPQGRVHLFAYGTGSPLRPALLRALGLRAERVAMVWKNLPPASVWRLTRQGADISPR